MGRRRHRYPLDSTLVTHDLAKPLNARRGLMLPSHGAPAMYAQPVHMQPILQPVMAPIKVTASVLAATVIAWQMCVSVTALAQSTSAGVMVGVDFLMGFFVQLPRDRD